MPGSLLERIRGFFVRDKFAHEFQLLTDYERALAKMSLSDLASELQRTQVRHETSNTIIVEHILASRLVRLQSRASWWSGWLGFAGAMLAAVLTFYLGYLGQRYAEHASTVECALAQESHEKTIHPVATTVNQDSLDRSPLLPHPGNENGKQRNTPSEP